MARAGAYRPHGAIQVLAYDWQDKKEGEIPKGHPHSCLPRQEKYLAHVDGRTGKAHVRIYDFTQLAW